jgi:acetyl-CoA synthase
MTSCGCFECIAALLPGCQGFMTVDRDFKDMTPVGMKFSTLAGVVGGGNINPGFVGHSKFYITSRKFLSAENGLLRLVWMPKRLKEEIMDRLVKRCKELGVPGLPGKIADETVALTEEQVLEFLQKHNHPVLSLPPIF